MLASPAKHSLLARSAATYKLVLMYVCMERGPIDEVSAYLQQQLNERQWDYDLVSLAADARVTGDGNLVGLQVPRTCEAASWEPNEVYEVLHEMRASYRRRVRRRLSTGS